MNNTTNLRRTRLIDAGRKSDRAKMLRGAIGVGLAAAMTLSTVATAFAQGVPLIRDTEIEDLLKDYSRPIFKAAGLGANNISMRIVRHESFNAFVIDGRNVFVNTGTLLQAKTPNEVIGVIAHETGHITGGHLSQLRERLKRDATKSLLLKILGIGLLVAGGAAGGDSRDGLAGAGQGVLMGGDELIMRSILADRRGQEAAADQAGLRYLNATRQSGRGMLETFERFAQQEYISDTYKDPFVRSHPVAADRLAQLRDAVEKSPHYARRDPPELQFRHDLVRAKIAGYLEPPQTVFNRYPRSDNSLPARYARTIALFRARGVRGALPEVDALIREKPQNAYFWELKGEMLMRSGSNAQAIDPLRRALKLSDGAALIGVRLAQALLGSSSKSAADVNEAVALSRKAVLEDPDSLGYRTLGLAYYKQGKYPQADLATAEAYYLDGNVERAKAFAKRAQSKFRNGSPEWRKADDILNVKEPS